MTVVVAAFAVVGIIGLVCGILIAVSARFFAVKTDPRIGLVAELLPGANCGGCGHAGCSDLAAKIVSGAASAGDCPVSSAETVAKINALIGKTGEAKEKKIAVVLCSGSRSVAGNVAEYNGTSDCRTAAFVQGAGKGCAFGCLGYGSCVRVCPFHAIEIIDGLAVVHPELCRGCGRCADVCPRKLIRLVPASAPFHIYCNSLAKPAKRRKFCKASCLSCGKCARTDSEHISSQGTFFRVNYNNLPDAGLMEKIKCPAGVIATHEQHVAAIKKAMNGKESGK